MKNKVSALLIFVAFAVAFVSPSAWGCVTTDDLSGGGYETSDASDPCGNIALLHVITKPRSQILPLRASILGGFSSVSGNDPGSPQLGLLAVSLGGWLGAFVLGQPIRRRELPKTHEVAA